MLVFLGACYVALAEARLSGLGLMEVEIHHRIHQEAQKYKMTLGSCIYNVCGGCLIKLLGSFGSR